MRRLLAFWLFAALCDRACAEGLDILAEHHAWGRFPVGAWSRLRETQFKTAADGSEQPTRVAVITRRLEEVYEDGVTLLTDEAVDGQPAETKTERIGWDGLPADRERQLRLSVGEIKIDGRTVVCQTHELTSTADGVKTIDKWWYSPDQSPYLLKRVLRSASGPAHFLSLETMALAVEKDVLGKPLVCVETKTIETFTDRASQTTSISSISIPGGLVSASAQLRDKQKGTVAGTRVELLEFDAGK